MTLFVFFQRGQPKTNLELRQLIAEANTSGSFSLRGVVDAKKSSSIDFKNKQNKKQNKTKRNWFHLLSRVLGYYSQGQEGRRQG